MVRRRYIIPSRIHPAFSAVGRWIGRRCGDSRQAESLHIAVTVLVGFGLLLVQAMSWTFFHPQVGLNLWVSAGALVAFVALFLLGRQPEMTVEMRADSLVVRRGASEDRVPLGRIERTSIIDDQLYYRHYRRFARTRAYVNRIPPTLLLIDTTDGPVVLGISESEQQELIELLAMAASCEVA